MGKPEKFLRKWRQNRPREVNCQEVKTVLDAYFPGLWKQKTGSHIVVRHECLKSELTFGPDGEFTVAVKSGQKVKGHYLKTILRAIDIIIETEAEEP